MSRASAAMLALAALLLGNPARAAEPAQVERGRAAFVHRCAMCHRDGGTGTNLIARRLGNAQALLEQRKDLQPEYVRHVVRWGYLNMPRISRVELPDGDLEALIAYLATGTR